MAIKLDEYYRIEQEAACWTLLYEKEGEINETTGKPSISRNASYHANLKQALTTYLDNCLKPSMDILDVRNRIAEVEKTINNLNATASGTAAP